MIRLLLVLFLLVGGCGGARAAAADGEAIDARIALLLLERDRLFRDRIMPPKAAADARIAETIHNRRVDLTNLVLAMLAEASARRRALTTEVDGFKRWRKEAERLATLETEVLQFEHDRVLRLSEAGLATDDALTTVNWRLNFARGELARLKRWDSAPPMPPLPPPYASARDSLSSALAEALAAGDWIEDTINKAMPGGTPDRQGLLRGTFEKAMIAAKSGDDRRAIDLLERVLLFAADAPQVLWNLAILSDRLGVRHQIAAAWYEAFAVASDDSSAADKAHRKAEALRGLAREQIAEQARRVAELVPQIPEADRTGEDAVVDAMAVHALALTGRPDDALRLARSASGERREAAISFLAQSYAKRGRIAEALAEARDNPAEAAVWRQGLGYGLVNLPAYSGDPDAMAETLTSALEDALRSRTPTLTAAVAEALIHLNRQNRKLARHAETTLLLVPEGTPLNNLALVELAGRLTELGRLDAAGGVARRIPDDTLERVAAVCAMAAALTPDHLQAKAEALHCRTLAKAALAKNRAADKPDGAQKQYLIRDVMTAAWAASERRHGTDIEIAVARAEIRNRWFAIQATRETAQKTGNSRRATILEWTAIASALPYSATPELDLVTKNSVLDLPQALRNISGRPSWVARRLAAGVSIQTYSLAFQDAATAANKPPPR